MGISVYVVSSSLIEHSIVISGKCGVTIQMSWSSVKLKRFTSWNLLFTTCFFDIINKTSVWLNCGLSVWLNCGLSVWLNCGLSVWLNCGLSVWLNCGLSVWLNCGLKVSVQYIWNLNAFALKMILANST
jgi:hypothetical protein